MSILHWTCILFFDCSRQSVKIPFCRVLVSYSEPGLWLTWIEIFDGRYPTFSLDLAIAIIAGEWIDDCHLLLLIVSKKWGWNRPSLFLEHWNFSALNWECTISPFCLQNFLKLLDSWCLWLWNKCEIVLVL